MFSSARFQRMPMLVLGFVAFLAAFALGGCGEDDAPPTLEEQVARDLALLEDAERVFVDRQETALGKAKILLAKMQMNNYANALKRHWAMHHRLPDSLKALTVPDQEGGTALLEELSHDPWGSPYEFVPIEDQHFFICSFGADGFEGTDDDIIWPRDVEGAQ